MNNKSWQFFILKHLTIVFASMLFLGGFSQSYAKTPQNKQSLLHVTTGNHKLQEKVQLAHMSQKFIQKVTKKLNALNEHNIFQERINAFPAEEKIFAFLKTMQGFHEKGLNSKILLKSLSSRKNHIEKALLSGSIIGTVTVEGMVPFDRVEVFAFDTYGFFAGSGYVDFMLGNYSITDLAPGNYYIVTNSLYVDEIYQDVILDFYKNWRAASLVTVSDGSITSGIDFDLLYGARVSGTVYNETGTVPFSYNYVNFEISSTTNPEVLFRPYAFTQNMGFYKITIPVIGNYKIKAETYDYMEDIYVEEYYNEKSDWLSADAVEIASLNDSIPNINFTLQEASSVITAGATIKGTVSGPQDLALNMAFVFAFNMADTSIAGLSISGGDDEQGKYEIGGLEPGTYVLYADQYFELTSPSIVQGEYYQDAATPDQADRIEITQETQLITDIDFILDPGGGISGKISDANQMPLDSVFVIAFRTDFTIINKFFIDEFDLGIGLSDESGSYSILGLSDGEYILRTFSLLGKYAGLILDEYYQDIQSIFDFSLANSVTVTVPNVTNDINFVLDHAGAISGNFYEADGSTPIMGEGVVIALNSETGLPELAIPIYNFESGLYQIGPLPTGDFKLLAFVDNEDVEEDIGPIEKKLNLIKGSSAIKLLQEDEIFYIPQLYDGKYTLEEANLVSVVAPNTTAQIDFKMVRAGAIQGFVNYEPETPVGADMLSETFVAAFDFVSGDFRGAANVTFAGGYRIHGLPPGVYKVIAWPASNEYAATYYGGGTNFDDENSLGVAVIPDGEATADIDLVNGAGSISGTVYNMDGSLNLDGVMVIAFDQTGHIVSVGISGLDMTSELPLDPGKYQIPGLVSGAYYVRTYSLLRTLSLLGMEDGLDFLSGNSTPDEELEIDDIQVYLDIWYENESIEIDIDPLTLIANLLFIDSEVVPPFLPLYNVPPPEADLVSVTNPEETPNIDFYLQLLDFEFIIDDLPEISDNEISNAFRLSQNYPNPFNPTTTIKFTIAKAENVKLEVFNTLGQNIATLVNREMEAGYHTIQFSAKNLASGIYYYKIEAGKFQSVKKMILAK